MDKSLLTQGLSDAVGFVGGALLGFWLGQFLGLNIFASGYGNDHRSKKMRRTFDHIEMTERHRIETPRVDCLAHLRRRISHRARLQARAYPRTTKIVPRADREIENDY